jgi:hypothetical protein
MLAIEQYLAKEEYKNRGRGSTTKTCECPICYEDIDENRNRTTTECGHTFHSSCIFKNMNEGSNGFQCPCCRHVLLEEKKPISEDDFSESDEEEGLYPRFQDPRLQEFQDPRFQESPEYNAQREEEHESERIRRTEDLHEEFVMEGLRWFFQRVNEDFDPVVNDTTTITCEDYVIIKEINTLLDFVPFSVINEWGNYEQLCEVSIDEYATIYYYESRDDDYWPIEHRLKNMYGTDKNWYDYLYFKDGYGDIYLFRDYINSKYQKV